jgi:hypothetical protein
MIHKPAILLFGILSGPLLAAPGDDDWAVKGAPWRVILGAETPPDAPGAGSVEDVTTCVMWFC